MQNLPPPKPHPNPTEYLRVRRPNGQYVNLRVGAIHSTHNNSSTDLIQLVEFSLAFCIINLFGFPVTIDMVYIN